MCMFWAITSSAQVVVSGNIPIDIPDNGCSSSSTAMSTASIISIHEDAIIHFGANGDNSTYPSYKIDTVWLDITHSWIPDIDITLTAPGGTPLNLSDDNGNNNDDNYTNTRFVDGAPNITTGSAPFTGAFEAEEDKFQNRYQGDGVKGDWTLSVCDDDLGISGTLNSFSISFSPTNDLCANATPIVMGTNHKGSNIGATMNNLPNALRSCSDDSSEGGVGVWYKYTGTGTDVIASTEHAYTNFDTEVLIYTGDCSNLVCLAGNDRGGDNNTSKAAFTAASGTDYYIYVDGATNTTTTGVFELSIESAVPNNTIDGAIEATFVNDSDSDCSTTTSLDFSIGTTKSGLENSCDGSSVGRDQFFYYDTNTDTLIWNSRGSGFPAITIWDESGTTELDCKINGVGGKLSGWERDDRIIIQIYDWITDFPAGAVIDFCLQDYIPPVANDECDSAIPLTVNATPGCNSLISATLYGATKSTMGLDVEEYEERDVWFTFVASDTAHVVQIENNSSVRIELFENNCLTHMSLGDYNDDDRLFRVGGLTIGTTYLLRVYDEFNDDPSDEIPFFICVGGLSPYDECEGAIDIPFNTTCSPQLYSFVGATERDNECGDPSIWLKVQVPISGVVAIETSGPGGTVDTEVSVFRGDCSNLVTIIDCQDEDNTDDDDHELVFVTIATPGEELYILVSDDQDDLGDFSLCVYYDSDIGSTPSDTCETATPLIVGTSCDPTLYNFIGAVSDPDECGDPGVWFSAVVPASGNLIFRTLYPGTTEDTEISVYTGTCGAGLTLIGSGCQNDDNTQDDGHEQVVISGQNEGDVIYFLVADESGSDGTFSVCVYDPGLIAVPSDICMTATSLTVGTSCEPQIYTFDGATNGADECDDNGVWFSAVVPASGILTFRTLFPGTNEDTEIKVYSGACDNLTPLSDECQDDDNTNDYNHEQITLEDLAVGATIFFVVDDRGEGGTFSVCLTEVGDNSDHLNDVCLTAQELTVGTSCNPQLFSFEGATEGDDECDYIGVWFSAIVPASGNLLFKTLSPGTNDNTEIKAYSGACDNLTLLSDDCQDYDNTDDENHEQIILKGLTPGDEIFFVVDDRDDGGTFSVCASDPGVIETPSDVCMTATPLSVGTTCNATLYTFDDATNGADECDDHLGVWFSAIVPASGTLVFQTLSPGGADTQVTAYKGDCGDLTLISEQCQDRDIIDGDHEFLSLNGLTEGDVIYFVVDDSGYGGAFSACAFEGGIIPSDVCATATPITVGEVCASSTIYSFAGATNGPSECDYRGVWFSITVPLSGQLYLRTLSQGYGGDTRMMVYRGTCGALLPLSQYCQDSDNTDDGNHEEIYLDNLVPGETIYLMVDDYDETELFGVCASSGSQFSNCTEDDALVSDALISYTSDSTFRTNRTLHSNIELGPYQQFYFRTEDSIVLNQNFSVPSGTEFIAEMGPCDE